MMVRVLFVCMGNICRSPAAEGIFRKFAENANLGNKSPLIQQERLITTQVSYQMPE